MFLGFPKYLDSWCREVAIITSWITAVTEVPTPLTTDVRSTEANCGACTKPSESTQIVTDFLPVIDWFAVCSTKATSYWENHICTLLLKIL